MTRKEAMELLGFKKLIQLADKLELTTAAYSAMAWRGDIPEYREYEVERISSQMRQKRLLKSKQNVAHANN